MILGSFFHINPQGVFPDFTIFSNCANFDFLGHQFVTSEKFDPQTCNERPGHYPLVGICFHFLLFLSREKRVLFLVYLILCDCDCFVCDCFLGLFGLFSLKI